MKTNTQKTVRSIDLALAALVVAMFAGCSAQPSAGDGKRVILDRIKNESEGRIKLVSFKKTNGQKGELMGVQFYGMEYQAEIEFTEDCKWVTGMFGLERGFRTVKSVAEPKNSHEYFDHSLNPGSLVKKGHRETLKGTITFEKTEKGWRAAWM